MVKLLVLILGLSIANPAIANCDGLLKTWANYYNSSSKDGKKKAKKVFAKIAKNCILAKK